MMSATTPSFKEAFGFWLKLGFISFGGPAGQIATMHQELVEKKRWVSEEQFMHALQYCMVLPGPEAQQLATYLGWAMHRTWGGITAGVLFVLPSLIILIALTWIYIRFGHTSIITSMFDFIKPAVIAIIFSTLYRIGRKTLRTKLLWSTAICSILATTILDAPFPLIVLGALAFGYFTTHSKNETTSVPIAVPDHMRFSKKRLIKILVVGLGLWSTSMLAVIAIFGLSHTYSQLSWFFSKAALVTFGGAYAVLPYVYQASVEHYQWLSATQMLDGLALGETTPGPLIMIVAFVGYIAGQAQEIGISPFWAGALGATLVTWFTFLPSFIFIFLGGPWIESTRHELRFSEPLQYVSAAVVAVILELAAFLTYHVFFPQGLQAINWLGISISTLSLIAMVYGKWSIVRVISVCALAGCTLALLPLI